MKKIAVIFISLMLAVSCGCSSVSYNGGSAKSNNFENKGTAEKTEKSENNTKSDEDIKSKKEKAEEKTKPAKENLIEKMSDSEKKDLNIFFSNFSESYFENYNYQLINDDNVIDLAYVHVIVNRSGNSGVFRDEKNTYIPLSLVNEVADKYLGITLSGKPTQRWNFDGTNYYRPSADGDTYDMFSVVTSLTDLGDGTYKADINSYYAGFESMDPKYYSYSDAQAKSECEFSYASEAVIRKKVYDGKNTWELVSLVKI